GGAAAGGGPARGPPPAPKGGGGRAAAPAAATPGGRRAGADPAAGRLAAGLERGVRRSALAVRSAQRSADRADPEVVGRRRPAGVRSGAVRAPSPHRAARRGWPGRLHLAARDLRRPLLRICTMLRSKVAVLRVRPDRVLEDIERLHALAEVERALAPGATTILKDNISWHFPFPAANTTPWQLEGTIRSLRSRGYSDLVCVQNKTVVTDAFKGEDLNGY